MTHLLNRAFLAAGVLALGLPSGVARAQLADTASTGVAFTEFDAACRATAARLWGPSLCGPIALVNRQSRLVVSNRALPEAGLRAAGSVWVGRLPDSVLVSNTSFRWHGVDFAMVMLPLPADAFDRTALLAHESFHRIQQSLGLSALEAPNTHLDERDARTWLRLELQALSYALTTSGAVQRAHLRSALAFRAERRRLFPDFAAREDSLEIQEGLAEYTGQAVAAARSTLGPLRHVRAIDAVVRRPSYVRSFAYATGPALGLALDAVAPGWCARVVQERSLSAMLARELERPAAREAGFSPAARAASPPDPVTLAEPYGLAAISAAEGARERERIARIAAYTKALVTGPVLRLPADGMNRSFDPNTLFAMDSLGVAYPLGVFQGPWGRLTVSEASDGALLSLDMRLLRVAAPPAPPTPEGRTIGGKGWTLELADGWGVAASNRPGDLVVVRKERD